LTKAQITGLMVEPMGKWISLKDGTTLLLTPVGEPLSQPQNSEDVANLYELFWKLCKKGAIHGDAGLLNVILHEGKHLWISWNWRLQAVIFASFDAEQLTWSILCYSLEVELEDAIKQLIMEYDNCSMLQNICCLSTKVCECLGLPAREASG